MTDVAAKTWFDITARANFEKHLIPFQPEWCLQLGCFAGDATVWMLENLSNARITDVDTFEGSDEHAGIDMAEVRQVYQQRTIDYYPLVDVLVGTTEEKLHYLWGQCEIFDFIYIDADHHAAAVLRDAVMAWPLLHQGGLMAFDDYQWGQPNLTMYEIPSCGANAFLMAYGDQLDVIEHNAQLWVKKR